MDVDYIIIGQGICGSFLSWNLIRAGKKVLVIDEPQQFTASKIASGIINPVTGRRIVRTWLIDELLPFAFNAYEQFGNELNIELVQTCSLIEFHTNPQMKESFEKKLTEEKAYLHIPANEEKFKKYFNYNYNVGEVSPCLLIDLNSMLSGWREKLEDDNALLKEHFNWNDCNIKTDVVAYKNITAKKIICCEGADGFNNPYFKMLPYVSVKGEALIAEIPQMPRTNIFKQGISIVPWKQNLFWIGSSYEWNYTHTKPTILFRKKTEEQLKYWLKLPYKIKDHFAAERPANIERRPFVGLHPLHKNIGILNGMGTKGCSLAPYFAHQLTQHLTQNISLNPLADVKRFTRILSM